MPWGKLGTYAPTGSGLLVAVECDRSGVVAIGLKSRGAGEGSVTVSNVQPSPKIKPPIVPTSNTLDRRMPTGRVPVSGLSRRVTKLALCAATCSARAAVSCFRAWSSTWRLFSRAATRLEYSDRC